MNYQRITWLIISVILCYQAYASDTGFIRINNPRIIESPPVMNMNAGYLEIDNTNSHPIILTDVTSDIFSKIEIHQSVIDDGVAIMKKSGPVTIPAHSRWIFKPGEYHLMLFKASRTLQAGETVKLRFHFADGVNVDTEAIVTSR